MKLSEWAKKHGVCYKTAWKMFKDGRLPGKVTQLPTGTVIIEEPSTQGKAVIYARVSGSDQKKDIDAQVGRLSVFSAQKGILVNDIVTEIGSGLNGNRPKLMKLLSNPEAVTIIVEHRERLARFGFEYIEAALRAQGRTVLVADNSELKDDLVQDMIDVLTSFCARLYGRRSAANRAKKAVLFINELKDEDLGDKESEPC